MVSKQWFCTATNSGNQPSNSFHLFAEGQRESFLSTRLHRPAIHLAPTSKHKQQFSPQHAVTSQQILQLPPRQQEFFTAPSGDTTKNWFTITTNARTIPKPRFHAAFFIVQSNQHEQPYRTDFLPFLCACFFAGFPRVLQGFCLIFTQNLLTFVFVVGVNGCRLVFYRFFTAKTEEENTVANRFGQALTLNVRLPW